MTISKRGGYWVTDDLTTLDISLTQIGERYRVLEEAAQPISATISDLERDWDPRWADYWKAKTAALATLRTATRACKQVFDKGSQEAPVALVLAVTALAYTSSLTALEVAIEEAGILITAHRAVARSTEEKHIRQRQRVLASLQTVHRETCDAILVARVQQGQALALHTHVCGSSEATEVQQ